jgi:hypothetical protein
MLKLIALVLGLAVGFGGGVYWAHANPDAAGKLSAEEEKQFLQAQLAITQKIQAKLDTLGTKAASKTPGSSFIGSGPGTASADVSDLKSETQKQQDELNKRLVQLK